MPLIPLKVQFTSPIFDKAKREPIISTGLTRIAKKFKTKTVDQMVYSPKTGRVYSKGKGPGFRRRHRASAFGERPAPDTMNLVRSVTDKKIDPNTHEVFVDGNDAPYGEYLERPYLNRPIMSALDAKAFEDGEMKAEIDKIGQALIG